MAEAYKNNPIIPRPLTTLERSWISDKIQELAPFADAPADRPSAMLEVAKMMATLSHRDFAEDTAEIVAEAYAIAVEDVPTWAVAAACRDWFRGLADGLGTVNFAFPPSPGQLAILARRHAFAARCDALRLRRLSEARPANMGKPSHAGARAALTLVPNMGSDR